MKYEFAVVDLSYLLRRNLYVCSRGKDVGEYTAGDVVKMTIQTLNKIPRDYGIEMDKYILVADKWDDTYQGYYRHHILSGSYKSDRTWMTEEKFEEIKNTPNIDPEELKKAEKELYMDRVMKETKDIMKNEFRYFGVPCIWQPGWEFDDCAYLFACLYYDFGSSKSVIITKDSDLQYSINPKVDYFRLPTNGSLPEIITYDDMYNRMPNEVKDAGISLYEYKSMLDSLGMGHNSMRRTKMTYADPDEAIVRVKSGDYSLINDPELFDLQLSTFNVFKFPGLEEITNKIKNDIFTIGRLGSLEDFRSFCRRHKIWGISDRYYTEFINRFNQKLFTE